MSKPTTEKYPTFVNVEKVEGKNTEGEDRYLVNMLLRKEQLEDLKDIAENYRATRSGRYHAMVRTIQEAIVKALESE